MSESIKGIAGKGAPWREGVSWWVVLAEGLVAVALGLYILLRPQHAGQITLQLMGAYLFFVVQGRARRITVRTGIEQNGWIEIMGGVKAGQPVVVSGNHELTHGMAVREAR